MFSQQVLGSFVLFQVEWPQLVLSGIIWLKTVSEMIKIDLFEVPGLACLWTSYSYEIKFHVRMATPLIISIMLAVPVPVAWYLALQESKRKSVELKLRLSRRPDPENVTHEHEQEDTSINWAQRFEKTVDTFMNNINFWVFIFILGCHSLHLREHLSACKRSAFVVPISQCPSVHKNVYAHM
jgi:hypothetical protein